MAPRNNNNNRQGGGGGHSRSATNTSNGDKKDGGKKQEAKEKTQAKNTNGPPSPPQSPARVSTPLDNGPRPPPKTELSKLNTSTTASTTGATGAPSSAVPDPAPSKKARDPTAAAVSELLGTMQCTLGALGKTFDVLGDQTIRVASLGPAVDAIHQIHAVQDELDKQQKRQEERMQEVKAEMQRDFRAYVRQKLRPEVNRIVAEVVKREIADRVRDQLNENIPVSLHEEIAQYKAQIVQIRTKLHNTEARRHNALIRASGLDEPLQPLLRPFPTPVDTSPAADYGLNGRTQTDRDVTDRDIRGSKANATGFPTPPNSSTGSTFSSASSSVSSSSSRTVRPTSVGGGGEGKGNRPLSVKTDISARTSAAVTALAYEPSSLRSAGSPKRVWDGEAPAPTPSRLFPRDLATLVAMGPEEAKMLLREYGIPSGGGDEDEDEENEYGRGENGTHREGKKPSALGHGVGSVGTGKRGAKPRPISTFTNVSDAAGSWVGTGLEGSREEDLNRFMRYIGVGFQVLPSSPVITLGNGMAVGLGGSAGVGGGMIRSPLVERPEYAFVR